MNAIGLFFVIAAMAGPVAPGEIAVVYTNSANGYLESCECPDKPNGGLSRRSTVLKELREKHPGMLLLDCGDNVEVRTDPIKVKYVEKMMKTMKYDAMAIGDQEFGLGLEHIRKTIGEGRLPYLVANLKDADGTELTKGSLVTKRNGIKVAVLSVICAEVFKYYPAEKTKGLQVDNAVKVLKREIEEVRKKVHLVIVLSHCGYDRDRKLAKQVDGIDLIVGGHSQILLKKPKKVGDTLIVQAGGNGEAVGKIVLSFNKKGEITGYKNEFIYLDKSVPDDPEFLKMIENYDKELTEYNKRLFEGGK